MRKLGKWNIVITEKYLINIKFLDGHNKEHYIIVQVNDNRLKIQSKTEYYLLDIGENVIVFSIEGHSQVHVAKND